MAQSLPTARYPAAQWPLVKKPAKSDYAFSRPDFLTRYGVTDSAIAIIKLYFYQ